MAVDTPHPQYLEFAGKWAKTRDAAAGEEAVKARRDEYLPMLKGQSDDDYAAYLKRTPYFNATARTVDGRGDGDCRWHGHQNGSSTGGRGELPEVYVWRESVAGCRWRIARRGNACRP